MDDDILAKLQTVSSKAAALFGLLEIEPSIHPRHQTTQCLSTRSVTDKKSCNMLLQSLLSQYVRFTQSLSRKWSIHALSQQNDSQRSIGHRLTDVFLRTWDLGFTAFGGPPVHFQILHSRFVEGKGGKEQWVDERTVL
jgi:hypothetical protein